MRTIPCRTSEQNAQTTKLSAWQPRETHKSRRTPRHALQDCGGLADFWYLDDGDTLRHPTLVITKVAALDAANAIVGADRHRQKTDVIYCVPDLDNADTEWRVADVRNLATVASTLHGNTTSVLQAIADVMRERVPLCQDPQHEFAPGSY